jgi:hypothetical protein
MVLFAVVGTFLSHILPFFTILVPDRLVILMSVANIVAIGILYFMVIKKMTQFSPWMFLAFPLTGMIFIYSIIRASILTFKRGGIVWRGTAYKLSELRNMNRKD